MALPVAGLAARFTVGSLSRAALSSGQRSTTIITAELKGVKIEHAKMQKAADRMRKRSLIRAGAYVRKVARSSLRRRKKPAPEGKPPSVHTKGGQGLKNIQFAWVPTSKTVVVGPVALSSRKTNRPGGALHEHGGRSTITIVNRRRGHSRKTRGRWKKRPIMNPAMMKGVKNSEIVRSFANQFTSA